MGHNGVGRRDPDVQMVEPGGLRILLRDVVGTDARCRWGACLVVIGLVAVAALAGCGRGRSSSSNGPGSNRASVPRQSVSTAIGYATQQGSFVVGSDGSDPRTLSTGLSFTGSPDPGAPQPVAGVISVSPDGRREAYWRDSDLPSRGLHDPTLGVWVASSDGTHPRQVWAAPRNYVQVRDPNPSLPTPRWDATGRRLALIVSRTSNSYGVLVMDANGHDAHYVNFGSGITGAMSPGYVQPLAWSPDGKTLAYAEDDEQGIGLLAVPVSGGTPRTVSYLGHTYPTTLSWSPDGRTILAGLDVANSHPYTGELEAVPASGGTGRVIYRGDPQLAAFYSPDGRQLAVTSKTLGTGNPRRSDGDPGDER